MCLAHVAQDVISRIARKETSGIETGENYAKRHSKSQISGPYYEVTGWSKSRHQLLKNLIFCDKKIQKCSLKINSLGPANHWKIRSDRAVIWPLKGSQKQLRGRRNRFSQLANMNFPIGFFKLALQYFR